MFPLKNISYNIKKKKEWPYVGKVCPNVINDSYYVTKTFLPLVGNVSQILTLFRTRHCREINLTLIYLISLSLRFPFDLVSRIRNILIDSNKILFRILYSIIKCKKSINRIYICKLKLKTSTLNNFISILYSFVIFVYISCWYLRYHLQ